MTTLNLHPDRLFSSEPAQRTAALYATVKDLPIVSPHGHTDPQWYADNEPFANASALFITPDHYVFRMLYSQGVTLEDLAIPRRDGGPVEKDARRIWHRFAAHYHLFRGTPTRVWLDHAFHETLAFGSASLRNPPTASSIRSMPASPSRSSVRARCSNASTSK
jgi:glucuronate isomerase